MKNEIMSCSGKWMELKNIILSEVSQAQKANLHVLSHMRIVDAKQMQHYGTWVTQRGGHTQEG
jgi:hypothetical protein